MPNDPKFMNIQCGDGAKHSFTAVSCPSRRFTGDYSEIECRMARWLKTRGYDLYGRLLSK